MYTRILIYLLRLPSSRTKKSVQQVIAFVSHLLRIERSLQRHTYGVTKVSNTENY